MKLREYKKEDADIICSWVQDEKSLFQWSADRIGKFPLTGADLNDNYAPVIGSNRFIPLTAVDEEAHVMGHLFIRYPDEKDNSTVRFGFVIIDPEVRGQGKGREILRMAMDYAGNVLKAELITLGVFANNDSARFCYESVGFRQAGKSEFYQTPFGEWECFELVFHL